MAEIHSIEKLLYIQGVSQTRQVLKANIFESQFQESTWDSLEKNGSFYFEKAQVPTKYAALGGTQRAPEEELLMIPVDQTGDTGPHQITSKSNGLEAFY